MKYGDLILSESSLLLYYKLDELSGTTAIDSKNGYNGTYVNTVTLGQTAGVGEGSSVLFSATPGYVDIGTVAILPSTGSYTLEAWVKVNTGITVSADAFGIMGYGSSATANKYNVFDFYANTTIRNWWWGNDLYWTMPDCSDGLWHHYITTFDGTTSKCYRDMVLLTAIVGSTARTGISALNTNLGISLAPTGGSPPASQLKYIDEVAIYGDALTLDQIKTHYAVGILQYNNAFPIPNTYIINRPRRVL